MRIEKVITDVFDFIASEIGKRSAAKAPARPDLSWIDISGLITDDDISSPEKFYAVTDDIPDVTITKTTRIPFMEISEGTFPAPVRTVFPENNTVYIKTFKATNVPPGRPVIIIINGLHVEKDFNFYFDFWALRFAAWGFDSAMVTMPYSQDRTPKDSFSGQHIITPETKWTLLSVRQSFLDTQLMANWLKSEGAGPVGLFGVSFGALMSGIYICNAKNADFAMMMMPPADIFDILGKWDFADELRLREADGETTLLSDPRVETLLSLKCMKPNAPLKNIFIAAGEYDRLVPIETIQEMDRNWGGLPNLNIYPAGHINTFALNPKMEIALRKFAKRELL